MGDWFGLVFIVLLIVAGLVAIKVLANPRPRTSDEFERNASENTTMVGALMNALHDVTDPGAERAKEVRMQMKDGRYRKKKREGKAGGDAQPGHSGGETDNEQPTTDDQQNI
jgi:hypothetical protein